MTNSFHTCLMGLVVGGLLTSCQPTVTTVTPNVPTRTVKHAMGTTQVPIAPERVVVLDYAPLDTAFALDILPIGRTTVTVSSVYPETINAIEIVGDGTRPNLEAILRLKPDLILGSKIGVGQWYRQLSEIAPTVLTKDNGRKGDWQENFRLHADALGQAEQAEQRLVDYHRRVNTIQAKLEQLAPTKTVSVIANWSGGVVAYSADSFSGAVLKDLGFGRNPHQGKGKRYGILLSKEKLSAIDGDILFLMHQSADEDSVAKTEFVSDPLWSTLNVVTQGVVCEVDSTTWAGGRSILAANQILTDVDRCLSQAN